MNWRAGILIFVPTFISAIRLQNSACAVSLTFFFDFDRLPFFPVVTCPANGCTTKIPLSLPPDSD
jgi:hypothetical protein